MPASLQRFSDNRKIDSSHERPIKCPYLPADVSADLGRRGMELREGLDSSGGECRAQKSPAAGRHWTCAEAQGLAQVIVADLTIQLAARFLRIERVQNFDAPRLGLSQIPFGKLVVEPISSNSSLKLTCGYRKSLRLQSRVQCG